MHSPVQHRPVPARTFFSVLAASLSERYAFATAAGPQRELLNCHVTRLSNVAATGRLQARSRRSGLRITENAMASDGTRDCPTTRAAAHRRLVVRTRLMKLMQCHRFMALNPSGRYTATGEMNKRRFGCGGMYAPLRISNFPPCGSQVLRTASHYKKICSPTARHALRVPDVWQTVTGCLPCADGPSGLTSAWDHRLLFNIAPMGASPRPLKL
jgi:hypothetical protein